MRSVFDQALMGRTLMEKTPSAFDNILAAKGRGKDSMIAHLSPREAGILKAFGGSGKINPATGMLEFDDSDSDSEGASDPGGVGGGSDAGTGVGGDTGTDSTADAAAANDAQSGAAATAAATAAANVGTPADPTGVYGMMANIPDLDPIGTFYDKYGGLARSAYAGFSLLGGIQGAVVGMGLYGLGKGMQNFASLSPAEQAAAIATGQQATGGTGVGGGGDATGDIGEDLAGSLVDAKPVGLADYKRIIIKNPYTYNAQTGTYTKRK